jgi:hypothetical protein
MLILSFVIRCGFWEITTILTPFRWDLLPGSFGSLDDPDYDTFLEGSVAYFWLCFGLRITKRMDLTKILIDKAKEDV